MSSRIVPADRHRLNGWLPELVEAAPVAPAKSIKVCDVCANTQAQGKGLTTVTAEDREAWPALAGWITTVCTRCSVGWRIAANRGRWTV